MVLPTATTRIVGIILTVLAIAFAYSVVVIHRETLLSTPLPGHPSHVISIVWEYTLMEGTLGYQVVTSNGDLTKKWLDASHTTPERIRSSGRIDYVNRNLRVLISDNCLLEDPGYAVD